jgi:hypothetical protein
VLAVGEAVRFGGEVSVEGASEGLELGKIDGVLVGNAVGIEVGGAEGNAVGA